MLASAAAGGYGVLARRLPTRDDPLNITSGTRLLSAPPPVWAAAVATAVIGSAAAFVLFNYAIAQVPAGRAALLLGLTPLFGVAAAAAGLHETITERQLLGGLIILAGLTAIARPGRCRPSHMSCLTSVDESWTTFRRASKTWR